MFICQVSAVGDDDADVPTIAATRERRERKPIKYNFDEGSDVDDDENDANADEIVSDEERPAMRENTVARKATKIRDDSDDEFKLDSDHVKEQILI